MMNDFDEFGAGSLPALAPDESIELSEEIPEIDPDALYIQTLVSIDNHLEHIDEFCSTTLMEFTESVSDTLSIVQDNGYWIFVVLFLFLSYNFFHNLVKSILRRY